MKPEECPLCWRFDCRCWAAQVDTHAKRGDVKQAPSARMGSAVGEADAPKGGRV